MVTLVYAKYLKKSVKFFLRVIDKAIKNSVSQLQQYEESIKFHEEMLCIAITLGKSLRALFNYLKELPITDIPAAEKQTNLSYNCVLKRFCFCRKPESLHRKIMP